MVTFLVGHRLTHVKRTDCVLGWQGHVPQAFWFSQLTLWGLSPSLGVSPLRALPSASTPSWYSLFPPVSLSFHTLPVSASPYQAGAPSMHPVFQFLLAHSPSPTIVPPILGSPAPPRRATPQAPAQFPALPCHFWSVSSSFQRDSFCLSWSYFCLCACEFLACEFSLNIKVLKFSNTKMIQLTLKC